MCGCGFTDSSQSINDAYNAARRGDWEKVKEITERRNKVVTADFDSFALLSLALFYTERDNPDSMERAQNLIRQAMDAKPERYDFALLYGFMLLNSGQVSKAKEQLLKAYNLHLNEKNSIGQETQGTIKYALGLCCLRNRTYEDAEKYLSQAIKSTPYSTWSRVYSDIACSLVYRGKYTEALAFLNQAIAVEQSRAKLRVRKMKELETLIASNASEADIKKKQDEIDELAPDERMYVIFLNMSIVCDYLSYKRYNPDSPEDFRDGVPAWYNYTKQLVNEAKAKTDSAKEKAELTRIVSEIDRRLAKLGKK